MLDTERSRRASAIVLLGLLVYLGAIAAARWQPYTFLFRDGAFYAQTNRSIAEGITLRQEGVQPRSWYDGSLPRYRNVDDAWSNVSVGPDGEWYPKHSFLMPIASTPFYLVSGPAGLLFFNLLALALGLFAGYRVAARAAGDLPAAVAIFGIASCPLVPFLAYAYSHDVFYGALVAGGVATLLAGRHLASGLLMGLALFAKATNVVILLPLVVFLFQGDRRQLLRLALGLAVPLAALAASNWLMYGAPWTFSYHRILVIQNGLPQVVSYTDAFDTPFLEGMERFFARSDEGEVWREAALGVVAFAGLVPLAFRSGRLAAGLLGAVTGFAVLFASYRYGGARFFLPLLMLAAVPGAALLDALSRGMLLLADAWRAIRRSRWATWAILLLIGGHMVGFGTAWVLRGGAARGGGNLAADVERLIVLVDQTPCDYFNLGRQKWECSGLDREDAMFTGLALGSQCDFAGRPVLRVPPAGGKGVRTVEWRPAVGGSRLRLHWGLDKGTRGGPVRFSVLAGERTAYQGTATTVGQMHATDLDIPVDVDVPVTIRLEPAPKGAALCLDLDVLD